MEKEAEKDNTLGVSQRKDKVHKILAYSYSVYFMFFLVGVFLDLFFKFKIFNFPEMGFIGIVLMFLASLLILWAQKTSRNLKKETLTAKTFCKGPYCITRSPTHWGLCFLMLGFGVMTGAFFIIISTILSFIFTKFVYLRKEEAILEKKYGAPYVEYKKLVRF